MSEENKTIELKDEVLEQVSGGFGEEGLLDAIKAKINQGQHPRVKVRHIDGYGNVVVEYGNAVNTGGGGFRIFIPTITVMIDGRSNGMDFSPSDVELVE